MFTLFSLTLCPLSIFSIWLCAELSGTKLFFLLLYFSDNKKMKERQKTYINIYCNIHKAVWTDNPCKKINIQTLCEHEYLALRCDVFHLQIKKAGWESFLEGWTTPCCGRKVKSTCCLLQRRTLASTKPPVSRQAK